MPFGHRATRQSPSPSVPLVSALRAGIDFRMEDDMTGLGVDLREWQREHEREVRHRRLADAISVEIMEIARKPTPGKWRDDVHDIVKLTAVTTIKRIFEQDAELAALKAERDHFRSVAARALMIAPPRLVIDAQGIVTEGGDAQRLR